MNNFFLELKNRNVYKVATAYAISGWFIMQLVDTVGDNLEWPNVIAATITKILIVGFPIALVLTWLYEFTPQGLTRTGTVQKDTTDNRKASRRLNHIIIGGLAITLCFMLVERVFFANRTAINELQKASIAVLPFINMSSEKENEYFADGITEQILDELAQLSGLQVTARTSSFKFKNKNEDVREIAKQLTVNYVLEGSVQYDSRRNRIKITTQLINASNGYHLWSGTFEDDFVEIFEIQEEVGREVASQLRVQLLPEEDIALSKKLTKNTDAYKLYLKSRQFSLLRNDASLKKGMDLLEEALKLDPNFAEAHAELAFLYGQRHFYGNMDKRKSEEKMEYHVEKAIMISPEKPEVLRAKARYFLGLRKDSTQVIADLRKAIKFKPSYADAHHMLFSALSWAKQPQLGIKSLENAVELDPLNNFFAEMLAQEYFRTFNKPEKGLAILDKIIDNDSSSSALRRKSTFIATEPRGDLVQAFKLIHEAGKQDPFSMANYNFHLLFALDLDLLPVSEKYARGFQMRYPDNERHTFNNILYLYAFKKEHEKRKEWIDFWASEKDLDPKTEAYERAGLNADWGNYNKAIEMLENASPELKKNDIDLDSLTIWQVDDWVIYVDLLRLNKENQKADSLSQEICKFYKRKIEIDSMIGLSKKNEILLNCYYLSNDTTNFLNSLEERFFVKKDRWSVFSDMKVGWYRRFENNSEYQVLEKRITKETHRMRAEVIAYLKAKGDWDPAWDKELGLE